MTAGLKSRLLFPLVTVLVVTSIAWLLAEGVHALVQGPQAETSLAYSLYSRVVFAWHRRAQADPLDPSTMMITSLSDIEAVIPLMKANGFGLGNSPFSELKTEATAMNSDVGPCRIHKPNMHKTIGFLRTNLFNPFDQMTFFYDAQRVIPPQLEAFLDRYAFRRVTHTTNEFGERLTVPKLELPRKVLIAGDSVANGVMLEDRETLASRLQQSDANRQYINLGIPGAEAADIVCATERAAARYHGAIDGLVYVLCENDWSADEAYGQPDTLIDWIKEFRKREEIREVTFLYVPYIYNTSPELTRVRGHMLYNFPTYHEEKHRVLELARAAGFKVVDYLDITNHERARRGTQFASLALYLDHTHPSPLGVKRLRSRMKAATATETVEGRESTR